MRKIAKSFENHSAGREVGQTAAIRVCYFGTITAESVTGMKPRTIILPRTLRAPEVIPEAEKEPAATTNHLAVVGGGSLIPEESRVHGCGALFAPSQIMNSSPFAIRGCILAGLVTLASAGSAAADPILFADTFTPSEVFFNGTGGACIGSNGATDTVSGEANGSCDSLAFSLFLPGYDPTVDTLYSALVSLAFHDDGGDGRETLNIQVDTLTRNLTVRSTGSNNNPTVFSLWNPLDQLSADGRLDLVLTQLTGDFWFDGAGVAAIGWRTDAAPENAPAAVPEPSSLLLLGGGVAGLIVTARRRRGGLREQER